MLECFIRMDQATTTMAWVNVEVPKSTLKSLAPINSHSKGLNLSLEIQNLFFNMSL